MSALPADYDERVYAGVLGKIIGVYLGRPFEGWPNAMIEERLGEVDYYVHDKVGVPLIVTDDDISGTFTFIRALEDYGCDPQITPKQIGQTWLNYLIKERTVLWWGGMGNSTEHTAYLRLQQGIDAPMSGSMEMNGKIVSEQIGAQIFIDGWAMVMPGDPERAADFARRAGSVSHDGEALYGAQVLAAMEAQAFVEQDINTLLDTGVAQIPSDSVLYRMIGDIRDWHAKHGDDWRATFQEIKSNYGYDKYGGNCHMVPNHGLIVHSLLHGEGDFQKSLMIVNTSGWDTDCNSGNLGCLMGIRNGIEGINEGPDWRGPIADICYLPTADAGSGVSDAATQARRIANMGRNLAGEPQPTNKDGARFSFEFPGSVQGFRGDNCEVSNAVASTGDRSLKISYEGNSDTPIRAMTGVFVESRETAKYFEQRGYGLMASPSLNPGQTVSTTIVSHAPENSSVEVAICVRAFNKDNELTYHQGPIQTIEPGKTANLNWIVPDMDGYPVSAVGIEVIDPQNRGAVFMERLDWQGAPNVRLSKREGSMWHRAWVNGIDQYAPRYSESFRLVHNIGTGLLIYGSRDWTDYQVSADVTPHLVKRSGIALRVQGMKRYYGLLMHRDGVLQIVREYDGTTVLAEIPYPMELYQTVQLTFSVEGTKLKGSIDSQIVIEADDRMLSEGAIALVVEEGRTATQAVEIQPINQ